MQGVESGLSFNSSHVAYVTFFLDIQLFVHTAGLNRHVKYCTWTVFKPFCPSEGKIVVSDLILGD